MGTGQEGSQVPQHLVEPRSRTGSREGGWARDFLSSAGLAGTQFAKDQAWGRVGRSTSEPPEIGLGEGKRELLPHGHRASGVMNTMWK